MNPQPLSNLLSSICVSVPLPTFPFRFPPSSLLFLPILLSLLSHFEETEVELQEIKREYEREISELK